MTYDVLNLTFNEPTASDVTLTDDLAKTIHQFQKQRREGLFHLCMIAYGLRRHNLEKSKVKRGGNARDQVYKPIFKKWYEDKRLKEVYGELPNFTLYAMSGRLLQYVRWKVEEKYIAALPSSLGALYECSQILFTQGDSATAVSRQRFKMALKNPIKDGSRNNTVINPTVTRQEIQNYRQDAPTKQVSKSKTAAISTETTITLGVIKIHKDLYKFSKRGTKTGAVSLANVEAFLKELKALVLRHGKKNNIFALESNFDQVKIDYKSAEKPDFGANLLKSKSKSVR